MINLFLALFGLNRRFKRKMHVANKVNLPFVFVLFATIGYHHSFRATKFRVFSLGSVHLSIKRFSLPCYQFEEGTGFLICLIAIRVHIQLGQPRYFKTGSEV